MRTYVLLYNNCTLFEICIACYLLHTKFEIIPVAITDPVVQTFEGLPIACSAKLDDIVLQEGDIIIIPGGDISPLVENDQLRRFMSTAKSCMCHIGAICSGVELLKNFKLVDEAELNNPIDVIVKDQYVLASANKYVDFALELGRVLGIYADEADFKETIDFFKLFRNV